MPIAQLIWPCLFSVSRALRWTDSDGVLCEYRCIVLRRIREGLVALALAGCMRSTCQLLLPAASLHHQACTYVVHVVLEAAQMASANTHTCTEYERMQTYRVRDAQKKIFVVLKCRNIVLEQSKCIVSISSLLRS